MKIFIAGDWQFSMYEEAFADALVEHGCDVERFSWSPFFTSIFGKAEAKWCYLGPMTIRLNLALIRAIKRARPDVLLIWRGTHILEASIMAAKHAGVKCLVSYNHDHFTGPIDGAPVPKHHRLLWRRFLKVAPKYDLHLVKREENVAYLAELGASRSVVFPMYFVPKIHRPVVLTTDELTRFKTDVVYVGHYEPDGRDKSIAALCRSGIKTRVFGGKYWKQSPMASELSELRNIYPVYGDDYARALSGASVCLAFLSRINRDTYTRRCVEIPACRKVLVCERTETMRNMFREDKEAVFFESESELVEKVLWLLGAPSVRESIAEAGMQRVWRDGYSVQVRASDFIRLVQCDGSV